MRQEFRAALGRLDAGIHTTAYLPIGGNGDWERTDCGLEDALDQRPVPAPATELGDRRSSWIWRDLVRMCAYHLLRRAVFDLDGGAVPRR